MTDQNQRILAAIFDAIDEVNELLPVETRVPKDEAAVLMGESGTLDSFGLVNLIVALEQRIEDEFGVSLILADEKAMSYSRSPFRTVATLREYVADLLKQHSHD